MVFHTYACAYTETLRLIVLGLEKHNTYRTKNYSPLHLLDALTVLIPYGTNTPSKDLALLSQHHGFRILKLLLHTEIYQYLVCFCKENSTTNAEMMPGYSIFLTRITIWNRRCRSENLC